MSRAGITPDRLVEAATDLIEAEGVAALTLTAVADRLGVKTPSLYSHIAGIDALRRAVALAAIEDLGDACRTAAMGRAGADALRAIAVAYRVAATARPGPYSLTQMARPGDEEWERVSQRVLEPVMAALEGIRGEEAVHATRFLRSALHGFVLLETGNGFGLATSVEESFRRLLDATIVGIADFTSA